MSTTYKISQLRNLFNDWENGLDQAVTLMSLFSIEVINEYWSTGWIQNPGNQDDRWKSDWIRPILMAYAPEGSIPYEAKKQDRIRHQKKNTGNYVEKVNELNLSGEWNHFSENILNQLIKSLNVNTLKFTSFNLFKKYLSNPVEVTHINVDINRVDIFITNDVYNLSKNIAAYIPRNIESLQLCIDDKYEVNFSENALLDLKNLKSFAFECNSNNGVLNFTNNPLLEEVIIKTVKETNAINIKGLNNCLALKKIEITSSYNANIIVEPIEISKLTNLMIFNLENVTYQSDIKGIIKKEFYLNKYWDKYDIGIKGINHIDLELKPSSEFQNKQFKIRGLPDLETLKLNGEVNEIELIGLPKLKEVSIDLQGDVELICICFSRELDSKLQIKANKLTCLSLVNYKNKDFPYFNVNELKIGRRYYYDDFYNERVNERVEDRLIIQIYESAIESLDGLENIKLDTVLILNSNNELKKLFRDSSIRCENIKRLVIRNSTITNLEGIHQFPNLTELVLNNLKNLNNLESIKGIETLTQLKTIELINCSLLTSLEPIVNLSSITNMKLSGCLALKPIPKRVNLSGIQVFEELKRHDKLRKNKKA